MASDIVRAACYYRMSDDRQENSIERQREQVGPHCALQQYRVVHEYEDEDRRAHRQSQVVQFREGLRLSLP